MFEHIPHPHAAARAKAGPVMVAEQHAVHSAVARFNARVAVLVTRGVGTMWCAYAFAAMDLISLPAAIRGGTQMIVAWIAQTFLQLVLLSIILVGQNVQSAAADKRSEAEYKDVEAILHGQQQIGDVLAQVAAAVVKPVGNAPAIPSPREGS